MKRFFGMPSCVGGMLDKVTELHSWMQEAAEIAGKNQPLVHKERVAFNFGVYMGVEILKVKFNDKLKWMKDELRKKQTPSTNYAAEMRMIDYILEYHDKMGEQ